MNCIKDSDDDIDRYIETHTHTYREREWVWERVPCHPSFFAYSYKKIMYFIFVV